MCSFRLTFCKLVNRLKDIFQIKNKNHYECVMILNYILLLFETNEFPCLKKKKKCVEMSLFFNWKFLKNFFLFFGSSKGECTCLHVLLKSYFKWRYDMFTMFFSRYVDVRLWVRFTKQIIMINVCDVAKRNMKHHKFNFPK